MVQDQAISLAINPTSGQISGNSSTWQDLDRVVLADVKKAWTEYQSVRDRSAIYGYLHLVFMQVDWWARKPEEMREALQSGERETTPNIELPDDKYAAVIMLTADPKKVDGKMRSKWSRVLQYAARIQARERVAAETFSSARAASINALRGMRVASGETARRGP